MKNKLKRKESSLGVTYFTFNLIQNRYLKDRQQTYPTQTLWGPIGLYSACAVICL